MPTSNWGWMILAFPLWGTIVIALGWQRWRGRAAGWLGTFAIAGSFVGAASYLLISFWYRRQTAVAAGIKAFVMNVIGDVGLVIAAFLLFDKTGSLDYAGVFANAPHVFHSNDGVLIGACLMLLVGAF